MSYPALSIGSLERNCANGTTEKILFKTGVNLLVGEPNTGKTKWLQTLDYLLGDPDENPFENAIEEGLANKYEGAAAEIFIGKERLWIERRWRERGSKGKIFVDGEGMGARDFQLLLLEKLGVPALNFPKGNPMSGQTWPLLSFRSLLRHMYRRQVFWSDIADKQPDNEQHACILQFLGLAEHIYTKDYGELVQRKMEVQRLMARREQYSETLNELAKDIVSEPEFRLGVSSHSVQQIDRKLIEEITTLRQQRIELISGTSDAALPSNVRNSVKVAAEKRAEMIVSLEELKIRGKRTSERIEEMVDYFNNLSEEILRMQRAADAGTVLADLKITHCPACDQSLSRSTSDLNHCFLCHQNLPDEPHVEGLGALRLEFELDRLAGEKKEAGELLEVLNREAKKLKSEISHGEEILKKIENELEPARQIVAGLIQEEVSSIDMALGELNERQRQIGRVSSALGLGEQLTKKVLELETQIGPLQESVNELARASDFSAGATQLEDGMNAYLTAINSYRPGAWKHSPVKVELFRTSFTIRIGTRRWKAALGGTDTLYFLMAYHFGLMTLFGKTNLHFPGLTIIDVPGEFSGEEVKDKENFIVQPFIDLLESEEYEGAQFIITGASFSGLENVNKNHLQHVYVA